MSDDEVNRIIAEFMGFDVFYFERYPLKYKKYTKSLDALVPVWERLELKPDFSQPKSKEGWHCHIYDGREGISTHGKSIQQAAAHATAKCILELNKDSLI